MFVLKQFVKMLVLPPGCWFVMLLAALIFWRRRWGRKLLLAVTIVIYLFHSALVSHSLSWYLESRYRPLDPASAAPYDAIVMLSAGAAAPAGLVPFPQIGAAQLHRLEEAYRLYQFSPRPIIVSGGHSNPFTPAKGENAIICAYLVRWGVRPEHIIPEAVSRDTFESALEVRKILQQRGWRRYLLVTSATHLPRSMLVFGRLAPEPVPAPGDFTVRNLLWTPFTLFPSAASERDILAALQEYIGLVNYRLRLAYDPSAR